MVRNKVILGPIFGGVSLSRIIFLGDERGFFPPREFVRPNDYTGEREILDY